MCHRCTPTSITTHLTTTAQPMSVLAYNGVNKSAVFANIHQFIRISQKIESWWGCFDSDSNSGRLTPTPHPCLQGFSGKQSPRDDT